MRGRNGHEAQGETRPRGAFARGKRPKSRAVFTTKIPGCSQRLARASIELQKRNNHAIALKSCIARACAALRSERTAPPPRRRRLCMLGKTTLTPRASTELFAQGSMLWIAWLSCARRCADNTRRARLSAGAPPSLGRERAAHAPRTKERHGARYRAPRPPRSLVKPGSASVP